MLGSLSGWTSSHAAGENSGDVVMRVESGSSTSGEKLFGQSIGLTLLDSSGGPCRYEFLVTRRRRPCPRPMEDRMKKDET